MVRAWLPAGCSMPCFPQWHSARGCGSYLLVSPRDLLIHPFRPHPPFNLLSQECCLLSPPLISKGWFCHLNNLLPFPQFPPARPVGSLALLWSPWAAAAMWHGSEPGLRVQGTGSVLPWAERHACSNMQVWVFFFFACLLCWLAHLLFLTHDIRERLAIKSWMYFLSISGCLVKCQKYNCFRELVSFYVQKAKGREREFCLC